MCLYIYITISSITTHIVWVVEGGILHSTYYTCSYYEETDDYDDP